jgi:hypothetical protein
MMSCEDFEMQVRFAIETKNDNTPSIGRLLLRILGIEEVYDWLTGQKEFSWRTIIDFIQVGEYALALYYLFGFLQTGQAIFPGLAKLLERLGPWFVALMIAIIIAEIGLWFYDRAKADTECQATIARLYAQTDCPERDRILRDLGVTIP